MLFEARLISYVHMLRAIKICTKVIVVACNPDIQLRRLVARDKSSQKDAEDRIRSQLPLEKKVQLGDIVLWNNNELEHIVRKAKVLASDLKKMYAGVSFDVFFSLPGMISLFVSLYGAFTMVSKYNGFRLPANL